MEFVRALIGSSSFAMNKVPEDQQVQFKVLAISANTADWQVPDLDPWLSIMKYYSWSKINSMGSGISGRVETVGKNVTLFQPGDEVFGYISNSERVTEFACTNEDTLAIKPKDISFVQAASVPVAAMMALQALRNTGKVVKGEKVLICGASSPVGSFSIQIAKSMGANVTAVCNRKDVERLGLYGADLVLDYSSFAVSTNDYLYDVILDVSCFWPIIECERILAPAGRYIAFRSTIGRFCVLLLFTIKYLLFGMLKSMNIASTSANCADLETIREMLASKTIVPLAGQRFALTSSKNCCSTRSENGHSPRPEQRMHKNSVYSYPPAPTINSQVDTISSCRQLPKKGTTDSRKANIKKLEKPDASLRKEKINNFDIFVYVDEES